MKRELEYNAHFEVRVRKELTEEEREVLREAMLEALDAAKLPYKADVVMGAVDGPL